MALRTMHELWQQASSNGEPLRPPSVSDTPETVLKFFEREDPVPSRRWESDEERTQRERLTELGGWCG